MRRMSTEPLDADVRAFLTQVPMFAGQTEEALAQVAREFRFRTYAANEIIFHQGDLPRSLYVVYSGKVRTYHLTLEGEETTVNILTRRQLLGELAVVDGRPRSASARAIDDCVLMEMSAETCLYYLERAPGMALALCRDIVAKVRWTSSYAEMMARYDAEGRLQHLLLLYNEQFGQEIEPGKRYVLDLGLNQGDLATLVGTTRGWVNTIIQSWRRRGLIEFTNGKITILDVQLFR